jgi:hypothetical protein
MSVVERMRRFMRTVVDNIQANVEKKGEYVGYGISLWMARMLTYADVCRRRPSMWATASLSGWRVC